MTVTNEATRAYVAVAISLFKESINQELAKSVLWEMANLMDVYTEKEIIEYAKLRGLL